MTLAACLAPEIFAADMASDVLLAGHLVNMMSIIVNKVKIAQLAIIMSGRGGGFMLDQKSVGSERQVAALERTRE